PPSFTASSNHSAIDFSDVGIDKARQIAERRGVEVNWIVGDVSTDELSAAEYDLVSVLYLHTGPEERLRWLPKVISAVGNSGTFIYIGHDPSNIEHGVGGPQKAELLPDSAAMCGALEGFRIDEAVIKERPVDADPGHGRELAGIARDTFIRAVRTSRE
ncbi:MAG: hypothetical protein ACC642_01805, partial [Pseudomonadales bacterium]